MKKLINSLELFYYKFLRHAFKIQINKLITKHKIYKNKEHQRFVKELKDNGYCIIEDFLNLDECEKIKNIIDEYIKNNKNKVWKAENNDSDFRLFGAEKIHNLINKYFKDENILNIGNLYLKSPIECVYTLAGKTSLVKQKNLGSGGGWHRDSIHPCYKSMLYLSDVESEDGSLQLINNSNNFKSLIEVNTQINKRLLDTRFENKEIEILKKKFDLIVSNITGKAGTLVLFDGSYIHRGSPIINKTRYALTNYFYFNIDRNRIKYPSPMV